MVIELNPALRPDALAAEYSKKLRIQVRDFLMPESAKAVHDELEKLPWAMAYNDGPKVVQLSEQQLASLDTREATQIMRGVHARARTLYQFLYSFFPILTAYFSPEAPRFGIFDFYEFINSERVLEFVREVTGLGEIKWADAQATWFKPGHFLKAHTDQEHSEGRLAAYVMNLAPSWDRDWGGFLQFFDDDDNVEQAFRPDFNVLNVFTIPQHHSVSMVSTYVTEKRLAVTGWFRSDEPPGPIGRRG